MPKLDQKKTISDSFSISKIMHRHVVTVDVATSARKCAEHIARERVGCLIVVDKNQPVGIVTERSFVQLVKRGNRDPGKIKTADFMASPLITITPQANFSEAMRVFNEKGIKRLPVVKKNRIVGLLTLTNMIGYSHLALTDLVEKHEKLKNDATIDALTGVANKKAIIGSLHKEYERIRRYGGRSSVLFIDIDHFKDINDRYSHLAGDAVLKELGNLLDNVCRQIDRIGRFGGEEFIVIAPNRKKYHAVRFGERLRKIIEDHTFPYQDTRIRLTVSIGIASLFAGRDYGYALERADKALYHAKNMGRNRIGLWRTGQLAIAEDPVSS